MKKVIIILLATVLVLGLAGCNRTPSQAQARQDDTISVVLMLGGNLGDLSFNDSAQRGIIRAREELGVRTRTIEHNSDPARWEPSFLEVSDEGHDIIIASNNFREFMERYADDYPDTVYIMYDSPIDWSLGKLSNVNNIIYKQNEGSFLGGYLLANMTQTGTIGFLGGMDMPVINDFLIGYIEGALHANPNIKIITTYSNTFADSARGKELALAMINQGADYSFNVAGGTGIGLIEAAVERGTKVLGVDSDQALMYQERGRLDFAEAIVSSMLKNVDFSLFRAINNFKNGTLVLGRAEFLGIAEGGTGLADNPYFRAQVPADIINNINALQQRIVSGQITIGSALDMPVDEVIAFRNSVRP